MIPTYFVGGVSLEGAKWDSIDDPYWLSTVLLMRMNGANGGTTFVDSSQVGTTFSVSQMTTSTEQSKSGGTSCKCSTTDIDKFYFTCVAAHQLTGDFTAEAWAYWTATPLTVSQPFSLGGTADVPLSVSNYSDNKLYVGHGGDKISGTTTVTHDAWHHIALTRTGSTIRLWLDGTQEGSTYSSSATFNVTGQKTRLGNLMGYSTADPYLDLVRITKADRYGTSSFTPPADY